MRKEQSVLIIIWFICMILGQCVYASVSIQDVKIVYHRLCITNGGCPNLRVVRDKQVNADSQCTEIVIYTGMLKFLDNRDQLAIILGHELGHLHNGDCTNIWHTFSMEYHADQYGVNLATKAKFNRCKGIKWFNKTMMYFGDYTSIDHPMDSLRLQRINYKCKG